MDKTFLCTIYTTSKDQWFKDQLEGINALLCKAQGVKEVQFTIEYINTELLKNYTQDPMNFNHTGVNFKWFKERIFKGKVDAECLHISRFEMQHFNISSMETLGGEYDVDKDDTLDFMVAIDKDTQSRYPELTEFQRVFIHEFCHGMSHWTTGNAGGIVHLYDEEMHMLPMLPAIYDFRKHTIMSTLRDLLKRATTVPARERLYNYCYNMLGTDISPKDTAVDMYGCADSVTEAMKAVVPGFSGSISTEKLEKIFVADARFEEVDYPKEGTIIISATGSSQSKIVKNGHVGVCGKNGKIMSNTSANGLWEENYTIQTWYERWGKNGYTIRYFDLVI